MSFNVTFEPTKKLFIDVLTKDITVRDCLLDIIDNSVDGYLRNKIKGRRRIDISISNESLEIFDTCGGIKKTDVESEVFRFGSSKANQKAATIGFYGIGLKRALFKLGEEVIFETDDGVDYCKLEINVAEWAELPGWELDGLTQKSRLSKKGLPYTRIRIVKLKEEIKQYFDTAFENDFKKTLSIYYSLFMKDRIDINFNTKKIIPFNLKIKVQSGSKPASFNSKIDDVSVKIICWIEPRTQSRMDKDVERVGWNIFMNERLVLHDDRSEQTGWTGEEKTMLPKAHSIYNEFRGMVFLNTKTPSKLPIDTTKTGFNIESPIYKYVLNQMVELATPIIRFLSSKYKKSSEQLSEEMQKEVEKNIKISEISIEHLKKDQKFVPVKPPKTIQALSSISYSKKKERVEKVKNYLKVKTNSEVGSETFEYFWVAEALDNE